MSLCPDTEFSNKFVEYMRNRMIVSYHKYGPVASAFPDKISALDSLRLRIEKYLSTGNTEFLVDAANFCMIEFMLPSIAGASFTGTDSNASPGRVTNSGVITRKDNDSV